MFAPGTQRNSGHFPAQVRLIFRPVYPDMNRPTDCLAYVEPFRPASGTIGVNDDDGFPAHVTDDDIEMFRVQRALRSDGTRRGLIIRLTDIWRPVELIPKFPATCPPSREWTAESAVELAREFYVNCFSDKEVYQNVY